MEVDNQNLKYAAVAGAAILVLAATYYYTRGEEQPAVVSEETKAGEK